MSGRTVSLVLAAALLAAASAWAQDARYVTVPVHGYLVPYGLGDVFSYSGEVHQFWFPARDGDGNTGWTVLSVLVAAGYSVLGTGQTVFLQSVRETAEGAVHAETLELTHDFWVMDSQGNPWFRTVRTVTTAAPRTGAVAALTPER